MTILETFGKNDLSTHNDNSTRKKLKWDGLMIQDEQIQRLMGFKLTFLQAKIYLNLAKLGKADVKTIAKASNVARQDVPIKEGLSILLQNIKNEYDKLQKETTSVINSFHAKNAEITLKEEEDTQFIITSEITRFLKTHRNQSQKAQESIDVMIPVINAPSKVKNEWTHVKRALKKGIRVRLITQEPGEETALTPWQDLMKDPFFKAKSSAAPIPFGMHIFDKKEITLQVSEGVLPSLWSNNPNVVKLASSYFDEMWNKTQQNRVKE
jgi:sugar-specific transcriptional regulator TrmB